MLIDKRNAIRAPKIVRTAVVLCSILLVSAAFAPARAQTMTFEGLKDGEQILNYYNGGLGNLGSGPGPNYGVVFGSSAVTYIESAHGGTGNFQNEPSPTTVTTFLSGGGAVMNVAGGFTTGLSFYYAAAVFPGVVTVYSGPNATGTVLATLTLPVTGDRCNGSIYDFSCWSPTGVAFSGVAQSVNFSGTVDAIGFDNITLGSASPLTAVPALSVWGAVLLAILLIVVAVRLLRAKPARA